MAESAQTFHFELVSPERKLISEPAHMVVVPGEEGDIGILPLHSALLSTLRAGVVEVRTANDNGTPRRIFIAGGFADITPDNCTVLAEEAVNVSDLNKGDLEQTIRNLEEDLGMAGDDTERTRVTRKLSLAKAKLEAVLGKSVV